MLIFNLLKCKYAVVFLLLTVLVVYWPAFNNDFLLLWDDQWQVLCTMTQTGFTWENLKTVFTESMSGQFFPVNQLGYMLVYELAGGYSAFAFHAFCVGLHMANTYLIYTLFVLLLKKNGRVHVEWIRPVSFVTALLFAVHPLNVESVAWISASKILVYTFFYLLALHTYLLFLDKRRWTYFLLVLFFFLCSFGGKEQAVIFPACLLFVDWAVNRNLKEKRVWLEKIPFLFVAFCMGCLTVYFAYGSYPFGNRINYPLWERIVFGCYSLVEYLFKWFVPIKLLYIYPFPCRIGEPLPVWMIFYPLLLSIVVLSFRKILTKWYVIFGLLFFFINIVMTLHIIPMPRFAIVADRYIYLSSAGLAFLVAYCICAACYNYKKIGNYLILAFSFYCIGLGAYSFQRVKVWHDSDTLKSELRNLLEERNEFLYSDI